jgi:hypothetical protein
MKKVLTKKDKELLSMVLLFVCDTDKREDECASFVESESKGDITSGEFHRWISKVSVELDHDL